jgi:glutathione S-transferase
MNGITGPVETESNCTVSLSTPILYSFRRCPYAMRARLALLASGIKVELREVVLRDKPASMVELSPKATVPVLLLNDGTIIDESLDVAKYALSQSDAFGLLAPVAGSSEDMMQLIDENDGPFKTALDHYKYPNRYENIDGDQARADASFFLYKLNDLLSKNGDYLFGKTISFADISIMPFVRQFANVDKDWFDSQDWPFLKKALDQFTKSDRFLSIMSKYAQWHEGDDVIYFGQQV